MNIRKILVALLVASIAVPAFASAATFSAGPKNEQVVEGHTVFTLIERVNEGWAVAGLVRDIAPKVLWFNDQYLVGEDSRYPCGGWVYAVPAGADSPLSEGIALDGVDYEYIESYRITDPNDVEWVIDLFSREYDVQINPTLLGPSASSLVWVVSILNNGVADDGVANCDPIVDAPPAGYLDPGVNGYCYSGGQYFDDGAQRCGPVTASCPGVVDGYPGGPAPNALDPVCDWPRLYNFLIFGYFSDLDGSDARGVDARDGDNKEYGTGGADSDDKNGCEEGPYSPDTIQYDCVDEDGAPTGDPHTAADPADDNEGNSHAYNPNICDLDGDGIIGSAGDGYCQGELHEHETARVDLYFSSTREPPAIVLREFAIDDTVGSAAPFHDHAVAGGTATCPPGWINPGGGYPLAPTPYC